jgi:hypothetical protein
MSACKANETWRAYVSPFSQFEIAVPKLQTAPRLGSQTSPRKALVQVRSWRISRFPAWLGGLRRSAGSSAAPSRNARQPIERFKEARHEFIRVAGRFDFDPDAKKRAAVLRQEMKSASEEISKSAGLMCEAERAGIAGQVKSLSREKERALHKDKGLEIER